MWRDDALLLDMLVAARRAQRFVGDVDRDGFEQSALHQSAVMRVLEVIGEAARKVSEATRDAHPEIPWGDIIGMRNRLIHEYFRVDVRQVWDTVRNDIPQLIVLLEPLVPPEEE